MKMRKYIAAFAAISGMATASFANVLVNPSFEDTPAPMGDVAGAAGWSGFNAFFTSRATAPNSGLQEIKVFGPFEANGGAGLLQNGFAATPGQSYTASAFAKNASTDALTSGDFAFVQLAFFNAAGGGVGTPTASPNITDLSPQDVYIPLVATAIAPADAATMQILLIKIQIAPIGGGAVFFDDASLDITPAAVPEPASIAALSLAGVGLVSRRRRRA